jgi:predicted RNA-binding Zn-ribbon protein involved in translation (DUF1610 family)
MTNVENGVIQFTCEHCKISLTVDDFLAGVSAPCPSCGKPTKAPDQRTEGRPPDVSSGLKSQQQVVRPPVGQRLEQDRDWDTGRPRNLPPQVRSETQREREEVAVVTKILVLGVIVLVGLLAAAYYANQAFNS